MAAHGKGGGGPPKGKKRPNEGQGGSAAKKPHHGGGKGGPGRPGGPGGGKGGKPSAAAGGKPDAAANGKPAAAPAAPLSRCVRGTPLWAAPQPGLRPPAADPAAAAAAAAEAPLTLPAAAAASSPPYPRAPPMKRAPVSRRAGRSRRRRRRQRRRTSARTLPPSRKRSTCGRSCGRRRPTRGRSGSWWTGSWAWWAGVFFYAGDESWGSGARVGRRARAPLIPHTRPHLAALNNRPRAVQRQGSGARRPALCQPRPAVLPQGGGARGARGNQQGGARRVGRIGCGAHRTARFDPQTTTKPERRRSRLRFANRPPPPLRAAEGLRPRARTPTESAPVGAGPGLRASPST
jgi:hypothetical protein